MTQMIVLPCGFFLLWLLIAAIPTTLWIVFRAGIHHLSLLYQVPCYTCVYYSGDSRLKCAVCPCQAASIAAVDCADYEPMRRSIQSPVYLNSSS